MSRIKNALVMSGMRLSSSGLGFFRNYLITKHFGLGGISDAYFVLTMLNNLANGFFGQIGGGVLLPIYNDQINANRSPEETRREQAKVLTAFFTYMRLFVILVSVYVCWQHEWLASIFYQPKAAGNIHYMETLMMITLPLSLLFSGASAINLVLTQRKQFSKLFIPEIICNIVFISLFWLLIGHFKQGVLIWLFPIGQAVIFFMYWSYLKTPWTLNWKLPMWQKAKPLLLPSVVIWLLGSMTSLTDNFFLLQLPQGHLSAYRYSGLIMGVIGMATLSSYQVTILPSIMLAGSQKNTSLLKKLLYKGSWEVFLFSIPIIGLGFLLSPFMIPLLFKRGAFDQHDTDLLLSAFQIMLWQLPIGVVGMLVYRVYNSLYLAGSQMWFNILSVIIRIAGLWIGLKLGGFTGLLWAMVAVSYIQTAITASYLILRHLNIKPPNKMQETALTGPER